MHSCPFLKMLVSSSDLDKINLDVVTTSWTHYFCLLFPALELPRKSSSPADGCLLPPYQEKNEIHHPSKVLGKHQRAQRFKGYKLLNIYVLKKASVSELQNSTKMWKKQRTLLFSYCRTTRSRISVCVTDISGQTGVSKSFVHSQHGWSRHAAGFGGKHGLASD